MARLQQNLDMEELIKRQASAQRVRNRQAVVVAALVGFVVGFLFSMALPYFSDLATVFCAALPIGATFHALAELARVLTYLLVGAVSVLCAKNAYDIMLALQHDVVE